MKPILFFLSITVCLPLLSQDSATENELRPLSQFVGYYNVGVKPNKPFFKSRWYLKDGDLYTIYDSDIDRKFEPYDNGKLNYNVFYDEDNLPPISAEDTTYYVILNFKEDKLEQFKVVRPRSEWSTDLYGYRMPGLDTLATHAEAQMGEELRTENFKFVYNEKDDDFIRSFAEKIEAMNAQLLTDFNLEPLPVTTFKIYPDLDSYHNGVLTPGAPSWQKGRVWTENEIKLVSPTFLKTEMGEVISDDLLTHEYIHILHWNKYGDPRYIPKWLWEGVALYKGCCEWGIDELDYLKKGDFPSLKEINRNSQYQYELGYYLIEFMDEKWGWKKVMELMKSNGDIKECFGLSNRKFEQAFYDHLQQAYGLN